MILLGDNISVFVSLDFTTYIIYWACGKRFIAFFCSTYTLPLFIVKSDINLSAIKDLPSISFSLNSICTGLYLLTVVPSPI